MKLYFKPVTILLIFCVISCKQKQLKLIENDVLLEMIKNDSMPDPNSVLLKNAEGHEISLDSLKTLELTGEYFEDFYVNEKGEVVEIVIRLRTQKDKDFIALLKKELNKVPELRPVEIDCSDKVNILQNVFDRDQGIRKPGATIDRKIDHENLEIIVSFLEKCGMPTLDEVNDVQMAGIWGVLQHSYPEYQSKYIPMLEEAAHKGDLKWSVIALMRDKALFHEGKPQIYGSQISYGKLYDLIEPEYVNQRRAEVGLGPLNEYLERFGLEFNVVQKEK